MSTPETVPPEVTAALETVSRRPFDNFLHCLLLGKFSLESGIPLKNWSTLLDQWPYDPAQTLSTYGRGNCVDFAAHTQQALAAIDYQTDVIGVLPPRLWSPNQCYAAGYSHVSLLARQQGLVMYEPAWRFNQPIPLLPVGDEALITDYRFKTTALRGDALTQQVIEADGHTYQRRFELAPLSLQALKRMTKGIQRVSRRLELNTLDETGAEVYLRYEPYNDALTSNIERLPGYFEPEDIRSRANNALSDMFGFDVKEHLLAALAIREALPEDFWIPGLAPEGQ